MVQVQKGGLQYQTNLILAEVRGIYLTYHLFNINDYLDIFEVVLNASITSAWLYSEDSEIDNMKYLS